jgi:hypothetical protein
VDLGDIIYLAFVIISVVLGLFGKKKKKGTPAEKTPGNDFSLEDFLRNAYGQQEEVQPSAHTKKVQEPEPEPEKPTVREFPRATKYESTRKSLYQEIKRKNAEAAKLKKKYSKSSPIYSDEISEAQQEDAFVFDAKQAVIYSEIMKRPEY